MYGTSVKLLICFMSVISEVFEIFFSCCCSFMNDGSNKRTNTSSEKISEYKLKLFLALRFQCYNYDDYEIRSLK